MSISDQILNILEENREGYLSGAEIGKLLGVSRTAVWKAVNSLKNEGYIIDAVTNNGYRISSENDILRTSGIRKYLDKENSWLDIHTYDTISSTNSVLREIAESGSPHGTVIVAASQTAGRGRLGRSFFSPHGSGIYMSVLLRPDTNISKAMLITTAAAVSVCEAIELLSDKKPMIKWVNDIFIDEKKVCGILTEASLGMENGKIAYAVLGIGINVYSPEKGFPGEISNIAGHIFEYKIYDMRNQICAEILNSFIKHYNDLNSNETYENYRKHNLALGRKINVISAQGSVPATVVDIDRTYRLIVRYDDGNENALSSGEISIKL